MPKSAEIINFYEYRDAEVSMHLPVYLSQKKRGMRLFEIRPKRSKDKLIHGFSLEFLNDDSVKAHQRIMTFVTPPDNENFSGVRGEIIRRSKPSYLTDGLEVLGMTHISAIDKKINGYEVLFSLASRHVYARFFGEGNLVRFDEACKQIVSSVRLVELGEPPLRAPQQRYAIEGLDRANTRLLKQTLDELPLEITYLRNPILAMAKENQDLLGSGQGDTLPIDTAIKRLRRSQGVRVSISTHADILRVWLSTLPESNSSWAAPAWFVEGFLRGYEFFKE